MSKLGKWLKKEFREILPVWAFFFLSFSLLSLTLSAVLSQYHVEVYTVPEYFLGSLIVAKAVILVDSFVKTDWFRSRPLIYPTLYNTGIYFVAALVVRHIEHVFKLVSRQHFGLLQANHRVFEAMTELNFWITIVWLIALIFAFCTLRELVRCIGEDRFMEMFFGKRPSSWRRSEKDIRKVS